MIWSRQLWSFTARVAYEETSNRLLCWKEESSFRTASVFEPGVWIFVRMIQFGGFSILLLIGSVLSHSSLCRHLIFFAGLPEFYHSFLSLSSSFRLLRIIFSWDIPTLWSWPSVAQLWFSHLLPWFPCLCFPAEQPESLRPDFSSELPPFPSIFWHEFVQSNVHYQHFYLFCCSKHCSKLGWSDGQVFFDREHFIDLTKHSIDLSVCWQRQV